jgi:hypothetical protein
LFFQHKRKEYIMDDQNRILAGLILSCKPEDLKGVALKADGSLAVVAPNGMKFVFSPVELDNARDSFCLPAVTSTSSVSGFSPAEPAQVPHGDICRAGIEANGQSSQRRRKESRP